MSSCPAASRWGFSPDVDQAWGAKHWGSLFACLFVYLFVLFVCLSGFSPDVDQAWWAKHWGSQGRSCRPRAQDFAAGRMSREFPGYRSPCATHSSGPNSKFVLQKTCNLGQSQSSTKEYWTGLDMDKQAAPVLVHEKHFFDMRTHLRNQSHLRSKISSASKSKNLWGWVEEVVFTRPEVFHLQLTLRM